MRIYNPNGVWYKNTSIFPMPDPMSGVTYPPGLLIKITVTPWVKMQPVMVEQENPERETQKSQVLAAPVTVVSEQPKLKLAQK